MNTLSSDELKMLLEKRHSPCVSLFMPRDHARPDIPQDLIGLRNLLRTAEGRLLEMGLRFPDAKQLLEPAHRLAEDESVWQQSGEGLALYLAPDMLRHYHLPLRFEQMVYVGTRIYVRPLLPLLSGNEPFYILTLSQNAVRLFRANRRSIGAVELSAVPHSLAEALQFDMPEKQMQFRSAAPVGAGRMAGMFYSSGDGADDAKERIGRYFHQIDRGLREILVHERAPLVLAGVDYLLPLYRDANKYPHIVEAGIVGNPDHLSPADLQRQACAMLQSYFQKKQQEAAAQFRELHGSGRTSDKIRLIIPAAYRGRVAVLFVALHGQQWGRFDPQSNYLQIARREKKPGDDDLLDLAASYTLLNDGAVYAVEPAQMPEATPLAATFRY